MIPILYESSETVFQNNGICRLPDCISCVVTEERNGIYECQFTYPIDGKGYSEIREGRIIAVIHDDVKDIQPFDIYSRSAPINGVVTFYAHHISYRLGNVILKPFSASSVVAAFSNFPSQTYNDCPFTFWTDKVSSGNFKVNVPTSIKEMLGGVSGSILDIFGGGEYQWDKFAVKLYAHRGQDTDVVIQYGKNLTDLTIDRDVSSSYDAVAPFWQDEHMGVVVTLQSGIVCKDGVQISDSKAVPLDLSEEWEEAPTEQQLRLKAESYLTSNKPYLPKENIRISFVQLLQSEEYANVAPLQRLSLCDKVNVIYGRMGVRLTGVQIIKVIYNVLLERYDSMELGEASTSFSDAVKADVENSLKRIMPTKSFMELAIESQTRLMQGGYGGHFVTNTNADGEPNEALFMDTKDISTAVNVLRINGNGIGFSHSGYNGPYFSAWTIDGAFNADYITAGTMSAARISGGTLTDLTGRNTWNLSTGAIDFETLSWTSEHSSMTPSGVLTCTGAEINGEFKTTGVSGNYATTFQIDSGKIKMYSFPTADSQNPDDYSDTTGVPAADIVRMTIHEGLDFNNVHSAAIEATDGTHLILVSKDNNYHSTVWIDPNNIVLDARDANSSEGEVRIYSKGNSYIQSGGDLLITSKTLSVSDGDTYGPAYGITTGNYVPVTQAYFINGICVGVI